MKDFQLYVITDNSPAGPRDLFETVEQAIDGGADVIQLRDKNASVKELLRTGRQLRIVCRRKGALFIVNDRPDIALAVDSDGVHLGQDDLPIAVARRIMGPDKVVGVSTHSLEQALEAQAEGADYIGVGPVFATPTKPEYKPVGLELIAWVKRSVHIPFVAIGGIDLNTLDQVISAGAERVAVVRAVMAAQDVKDAAGRLKQKLVSACCQLKNSMNNKTKTEGNK